MLLAGRPTLEKSPNDFCLSSPERQCGADEILLDVFHVCLLVDVIMNKFFRSFRFFSEYKESWLAGWFEPFRRNHRYTFDFDHQRGVGKSLNTDQCAGRQVGVEILVTLVVYAMVFIYVGGESRSLDDIGVIATNRAQRATDVLAHLAQLRAHVTGMNRCGIFLAPRCHSGDEHERPAGNGDDLRMRL